MARGTSAWTTLTSWQVLPSPAAAEGLEILSPPAMLASLDVVSCSDRSFIGTPALPAFPPPSPALREIRACPKAQRQAPGSCPRKVGPEGDREQDGDCSRGCWEDASLPGLML